MDRAIDSDAAEGQRVDSCEEEGLEQVKWCAFVERHTATYYGHIVCCYK